MQAPDQTQEVTGSAAVKASQATTMISTCDDNQMRKDLVVKNVAVPEGHS